MNRKVATVLGVLSTSFILSTTTTQEVFAATMPEPSYEFYVYDGADILTLETEQYVLQANKDFEHTEEQPQIVLATIESLEGVSVAEYAVDLFKEWGIGDAELDNGVLILMSESERQIRIEVGYGMEGYINDAKSGNILDQNIEALRDNDFDTALRGVFMGVESEVGSYLSGEEMVIEVPEQESAREELDTGTILTVLTSLLAIIGGVAGVQKYRQKKFQRAYEQHLKKLEKFVSDNHKGIIGELQKDVDDYYTVYFNKNTNQYTLLSIDILPELNEAKAYGKSFLTTTITEQHLNEMVLFVFSDSFRNTHQTDIEKLENSFSRYTQNLINKPMSLLKDVIVPELQTKRMEEVTNNYQEAVKRYIYQNHERWYSATNYVINKQPNSYQEIEAQLEKLKIRVHIIDKELESRFEQLKYNTTNANISSISVHFSEEYAKYTSDNLVYSLTRVLTGSNVDRIFDDLYEKYAVLYVEDALSGSTREYRREFERKYGNKYYKWFVDCESKSSIRSKYKRLCDKLDEEEAERRRQAALAATISASSSYSSSSGGGGFGGGGSSGGGGASRGF